MTITVHPVNAVTGAPAYSGRMLRQTKSPAVIGATSARPLGARSGVRPGTPTNTVTATSTTWTCKPHAGVLDGQSANEAGAYWYAVDANVTGSVTAANATNPRKDIIYARVDDPAESDGTSVPAVAIAYLAGTAAASPVPPATPARSMVLAIINVPASGGGSPTVTWSAPYAVGAGGIIPVRTTTERDALAALGNTDCPVWVDVAGTLYRGNGSTWTKLSPTTTVTTAGAVTLGTPDTTNKTVNITFGVTYDAAPQVVVGNVVNVSGYTVITYVTTTSTTGATIRYRASSALGGDATVSWIAVGTIAA